jgi:hypothetical protein
MSEKAQRYASLTAGFAVILFTNFYIGETPPGVGDALCRARHSLLRLASCLSGPLGRTLPGRATRGPG